MVFQIILQLEGIVLKVIGIILQQNIMGMCVPFVISLCFDQCPASHLPDHHEVRLCGNSYGCSVFRLKSVIWNH